MVKSAPLAYSSSRLNYLQESKEITKENIYKPKHSSHCLPCLFHSSINLNPFLSFLASSLLPLYQALPLSSAVPSTSKPLSPSSAVVAAGRGSYVRCQGLNPQRSLRLRLTKRSLYSEPLFRGTKPIFGALIRKD